MKKKLNNTLPFTGEQVPTGVYSGMLPEKIMIKGEEWQCVKTMVINGVTHDKIRNFNTNQVNVLKRQDLLKIIK